MPQLRGKTLDQAQESLRLAGFTATVRGVNVNIDKDVVADQMPEAGAQLAPGGTVAILVGTGFTPIPDVSNMSRDQAVRTLQASSFVPIERDRRDQVVPAGAALDTQPEAGLVAPRRSQVQLDVSLGR